MERRRMMGLGLLAGLAISCSGGGGGSGPPSGNFLDSAVSGLTYTSGTLVGTTDSNGRFRYRPGQQVMFAVGDLVIGLGPGAPIMTPVDLEGFATDETNEVVINIARFLQTLDFDQDPDNGIEITEAVQMAASGVNIDFTQSVANFETLEQADVDTITAVLPGGSRTLVPAAQAQAHLASTLRTAVAGRYEGRYSGDDSGPFAVFIDQSGSLFGWAVSAFDGTINLTGGADTAGGFVAGDASTGAMFMGTLEADGTLSGTWQLGPESGSFSGSRRLAVDNDLDRDLIASLAGTYVGTTTTGGLVEAITVLMDAQGNLTQPAPDDNISATVTRTSATTLTFQGLDDEGSRFQGTIDMAGNLSGSFNNNLENESGTFEATLQ